MSFFQKISLLLLRVSFGWLFLYSGITKLLNPDWSAAGYIGGASTLSSLYQWLAQPGILPWVNFLNEWGQVFLGVALILGFFVRPAAITGAVLMLLYYFPVLAFPLVGEHSYIVDEHILYALALLILAAFKAGRVWGIDSRL
ncbi:MAG: hypothetical protein AMXMBFR44_5200 [Candidatus Campbellbacteria bacterium]